MFSPMASKMASPASPWQEGNSNRLSPQGTGVQTLEAERRPENSY